MSKKLFCIIAIALLAVSMTSCISTKSYVDPQYRLAKYEDIKTVAKKYAVAVDVEFQRNGEKLPSVDNELRTHVEIALRASGVIIPSPQPADYTIKVTANNIADMGAATGKGFATGLTFGAAGSVVSDFYEFTISYKMGNSDAIVKQYKHAIHTTIGNKSAPVSAEPTTPAIAFGKVVEDVILNFVKEMQAQDKLTLNRNTDCFANLTAPASNLITVCHTTLAVR